jgi:fructosamine-3-kinase
LSWGFRYGRGLHEYLEPIQTAVSDHLGRPWRATAFTDLRDRASHRCGIFHGPSFAVFAKLTSPAEGAAELRGLDLLRRHAVATPQTLASVRVPAGALLLLEAVPEVPRSTPQWQAIGTALGQMHQVTDASFGAGFDGYFGPLPQDNRPAAPWATFFATRRLEPRLREAVDSGRLAPDLAAGVARVIARLPALVGPEPRPTLVHGDAQQNNFVTGPERAWVVDAAPHFGHPESDLALVDYFEPVPPVLFEAYREVGLIDPGFAERRELWRLPGYLAVVTVAGETDFGRPFLGRITEAVRRYR